MLLLLCWLDQVGKGIMQRGLTGWGLLLWILCVVLYAEDTSWAVPCYCLSFFFVFFFRTLSCCMLLDYGVTPAGQPALLSVAGSSMGVTLDAVG